MIDYTTKIEVIDGYNNYGKMRAANAKPGQYVLSGLSISKIYFVYKCKHTVLMRKFYVQHNDKEYSIAVTYNHEMLINNQAITAEAVKIGDRLLFWDGSLLPIYKIEHISSRPIAILTTDHSLMCNKIIIPCETSGIAKYIVKPLRPLCGISTALVNQSLYKPFRRIYKKIT